MTDMPPKIWAKQEDDSNFAQTGIWSTDRCQYYDDLEFCYVRLIVAQSKKADIESRAGLRIEALTEALQSIHDVPFDKPANFHASDEDWLKRRAQMMQNAARIALNP
jgi:hypothetical protein